MSDDTSEQMEFFLWLMQNWFNSFSSKNLKNVSDNENILYYLELYKMDKTIATSWFPKLSNDRYQWKVFADIYSNILLKKSLEYPIENDYRQVYEILSKVLRGELPELDRISEKASHILIDLIENLLSSSRDDSQLLSIPEQNNDDNDNSNDDDDQSDDPYKILCKLAPLRKFRKFSDPLNIREWNKDG